MTPWQETGALRDFDPVYVALGSRLGRPATSVTCPFYPQYLP
jgi:hypothetical protein